eukprot:gb/GFBE01022688.1/.p2 GENE.gb/GFBE01022688.1/~~gb/GFBE01022688.1/.p2  ORF type:complete len:381 (-),score=96.65 gb/GFBE01022688.1/:1-1143(-)
MTRWEVVGGTDKGGILVREGQALGSKATTDRLSTGAVVEELQLVGDRLRYELTSGTGPKTGWVSVKISGKDLLVRKEDGPAVASSAAAAQDAAPAGDDYPYMKGGTAATEKTPWLKMLGKAKPDAKARLIIFSWTGNRGGQGSAHNFMKLPSPAWAELFGSYEHYEVNYPGRGTRMKDSLYEDSAKYAQDIASALEAALKGGKPMAFLGFSFGGILAMEVARHLQAKAMGPMCVAVASAEGPQWDGRAKMGLAKMDEAAFEKMLHDKGGTDFILKDPGMKKMFVPVINADCKLEESYRYDPAGGALKCPVLVFHGKKEGHDKMKTQIDSKDAALWLEATACQKLSQVEALESDWYIFQDAGATEAVARAVTDFCAPRIAA